MNNPEINKIDFQEVLSACGELINNNNEKPLDELYKCLTVRVYLTLSEKTLLLYTFMRDIEADIDASPAVFVQELERATIFSGLMFYTNVDQYTITNDLRDFSHYDLLMASGFCDTVLKYCSKDFDRLCKMMDRTLSYENLKNLFETLQSLDTTEIGRMVDTFNEFRTALTPQMITDLSDIMRFNDPSMYQLKQNVEKTALEQLVDMDRKEKKETGTDTE